ncbi:unnamed protein product [Paramecium octaurelia]|uniref:Transmembrane protein n=1 Tax=Paramecium octaurelia TaxID=43137 RepID=A0A8S1U3E4_PAROT|nr:unnamed protein product [Paramecium octaurelia]
MNKYQLSFKDKEIEQMYQTKQHNELRILTLNIISIGLFVYYFVISLNSVIMNRFDFLFWKLLMMAYMLVQYYTVKKYPQLLRLAFILTNHLNSILYIFASDDQYTHEFDIIKGANQMGMEIIIVLSGEFLDAVFSILSLNLIRVIYGIMHSDIQFYVPHVTTAILVIYFVFFFYKFHYARRSQFLLTLIDSQWDNILSNLIRKQSYVIFTFEEEQLHYSIKQINNCGQFFFQNQDVFSFLRESNYQGKTVESIILQDIKLFQINHQKRMNIDLICQFHKEIFHIQYSIYSGQNPTILIIFKEHSMNKRKNKLINFDQTYNNFVTLFLKVLNNITPTQLKYQEYIQIKRQLFLFKLLNFIQERQFNQKMVNLSQNLASMASLYPEKKIFYENIDGSHQIKTISNILYFFQMIVLENSIGRGVKIQYKSQQQIYTLTFFGSFNFNKLKFVVSKLSYPLKMIFYKTNITAQRITCEFHQEPLIPFTRLHASKYHCN